MKEADSPIPLWDYCHERRARINNFLAKDMLQLQGNSAHFLVTGEEGDISNLCQSKRQWNEPMGVETQRQSGAKEIMLTPDLHRTTQWIWTKEEKAFDALIEGKWEHHQHSKS